MPRATPLALALLFAAPVPALAQLAPPSIRIVRPFGVTPGGVTTLEVRGKDLDGASALWFAAPRIKADGLILSKPEATDGRLGRKLTARVALPADLAPGVHAFRVVTPRGISNPGRLWVGRPLVTLDEREPNNGLRKAQAVAIPAAIEGAIEPGDDVDLFAVELKAGETLVAEAIAARAGSGLDALVTLFGPDGRELASDDDGFGRDAAAWATAPSSGRYVVQVQDANGRNREDKVEQVTAREYRLELGVLPLVASSFPAGARRGERAELLLLGANLPDRGRVAFSPSADVSPGPVPFQAVASANVATLRVGDSPESFESEPNDEVAGASEVVVPAAINGRLTPTGDGRREGDVDLFRLRARPGREGIYRISAFAAGVGSPADPVLTVLDAKGDPQGEDDDALGRDARIERPIDSKDGILLAIRDYYGRGGPHFVYRVEVEPIGRSASVAASPGSRTLPRRGSVAIPISVERHGYDGPLTVLTGVLPPGITSAPITILPRVATATLVLSASDEAPLGPFSLRLTTRDSAVAVDLAFDGDRDRDRDRRESCESVMAVAEPAPLGLAIEPADLLLSPGGEARLTLKLDRRGDAGKKKAVTLRLLAPGGSLDGLEGVPGEITIAADSAESSLTLKARVDAAPRRVPLSATARFQGASESASIAAAPATLIVPDRPR